MKMKRPGRPPIAVGRFGAWLLSNMAMRNMTYDELAKKAHLSHGNVVCKHVRHHAKPSFQTVVTYCWCFGIESIDTVNIVWKLLEEDWA